MNRIKSGRKKRSLKIAAVLTAMALCAGMWGQTGLVSRASNSLGSQTGQEGSDAPAEEAPAENTDGADVEGQIVEENTESMAGTSTAAKVRVIPASARLRGEASTSSDQVGSLSSGDEIAVVGETTGSDGMLWYQVSGDVNGENVSGYIRSDLVEVTETVQAEVPSETPSEAPVETPSEPESSAPSDEYSVSYADDGTGTGVSDWYLNDNINGTRYKISDLLNAQQTNESNIAVMEEQTGSMRMIIIILAVIVGLLVVVVTILIFKLRSSYEDDGYDDDEDYGDDDDRYEEEDEEDEEDYVPEKRRGAVRRPVRSRQPARRSRYDEDDEDEEDDRYEDEEDEEEPPRRSSRSSGRPQAGRAKGQRGGYKPKNFADMDEDDDLDFEFLDLK